MTLPKCSEGPPAHAIGRYGDNHGGPLGHGPLAAANRGYLDTDFPDSVARPYLPKQRQLRRLNSLAVAFHSSFAGVNTCEGDRLIEPLPPRGLVATNSKHRRSLIPAVVWAGAERLRGCSASRSKFHSELVDHVLADVPDRSHFLRRLSSSGLDEIEPNEKRAEACSRKPRMRFNP